MYLIIYAIFLALATLLCVVGNPVPSPDSSAVPRSDEHAIPPEAIPNPTHFVEPRHLPLVVRPRCHYVNQGLYQSFTVANLCTDEWTNPVRYETDDWNYETLRLLENEVNSCGFTANWTDIKSQNGDVDTVTFNMPQKTEKGCIDRAFENASGIFDMDCKHYSNRSSIIKDMSQKIAEIGQDVAEMTSQIYETYENVTSDIKGAQEGAKIGQTASFKAPSTQSAKSYNVNRASAGQGRLWKELRTMYRSVQLVPTSPKNAPEDMKYAANIDGNTVVGSEAEITAYTDAVLR